MAERTIVLDGFSKTFAMTGWRLGYAIVPPSLVATYGQLVINTISCAPTFAQVGAVEAIRGPQEPMADDGRGVPRPARSRRRRASTRSRGSAACRPKGAFYVFPDISGTGLTGRELADRLLQEAGVCVLAGTAFGGIGDRPRPHLATRPPARTWRRRSGGSGRSSRRCRAAPGLRVPSMSADRPKVFVSRRIPDDGIDPIVAAPATRASGRTSCRRRAPSCCAAVPAATAS